MSILAAHIVDANGQHLPSDLEVCIPCHKETGKTPNPP